MRILFCTVTSNIDDNANPSVDRILKKSSGKMRVIINSTNTQNFNSIGPEVSEKKYHKVDLKSLPP